MEIKNNPKNNLKEKIKLIPQTYKRKKFAKSKLNNFTVNSLISKTNYFTKEEMTSKDLFNIFKLNKNKNKNKDRFKNSSKTHSNKKIFIKIQQKTDLSEYNIILDRTNDTFKIKNKRNENIKTSLKKKSKTINKHNNNNFYDIENLNESNNSNYKKNYDKKRNISENRNENKDKLNNSDVINTSFGDSSIEINRPKKSENFLFNKFIGRKSSSIPHPCKNNFYEKLFIYKDTEESNNKYEENEIKNKILKHNITEYSYERNNKIFKDNYNKVNKNILNYSPLNTVNNEINNFINKIDYKKLNNNEFLRLSNVSKYNSNDLFYLNNKNINSEYNFSKIKNSSYFINPKVEQSEGEENNIIKDFSKVIIDNKIKKKKKEKDKKIDNDNLISIPCMNCGKMIKTDDIDIHSNDCFKVKEEIILSRNNNHIIIIENKLKNIYEYLVNYLNDELDTRIVFNQDFISTMKTNIEQILNIKIINSLSIQKLIEINIIFKELMKKYFNSSNLFTILSRTKILLEEKIKYFKKLNINNTIDNFQKKTKKLKEFDNNKDNKILLRNTINIPRINNKNYYFNNDYSIDEAISEGETMEFFDLKKMKKILDEKRELKTENLDNFVNMAKNKRLFLMEVLKVKYQKISENKTEIPPIMIWKEAKKKKIKMNNWSKFIFEELNNPNKYLNMNQKEKLKK